jgi:hypothetical protein
MRIRYALVALLLLCAPAHAQQTKAAMTATIGNCFPTQSVGAITPASVVTCLTTLINSYQQYTTVRAVTTPTDTIATTDYGVLIKYSSSIPITETLAQATGTFAPFSFFATNNGTAIATIVPGTSTIGGNATLPLLPGQSAFIVADGVNWDVWQTAQVASSTALGLAQCDGTTTTCANGVITSLAPTGASITVGTTTINSGVNGSCLSELGGKLSQIPCASLTAPDQVVSGGAVITPFSIGTIASGTKVIDCGQNAGQWLVNNGAFSLAAPINDGLCVVEVINGASAGTLTLVNFSSKGAQGATYTTATSTQSTVTFTNGSAVISWITNTLGMNAPIYFTGGGGSLPINIPTNTLLYVVVTGTNAIQVSATPSSAAIVASSTGTGALVGEAPGVFDLSVTRINGTTLGVWSQAQ